MATKRVNLGWLVRQRRGARTLRGFAATLPGVSVSTLCRVEAGTDCSLDTLALLCRTLGISADTLLGLEPAMETPLTDLHLALARLGVPGAVATALIRIAELTVEKTTEVVR